MRNETDQQCSFDSAEGSAPNSLTRIEKVEIRAEGFSGVIYLPKAYVAKVALEGRPVFHDGREGGHPVLRLEELRSFRKFLDVVIARLEQTPSAFAGSIETS